MTSSAVALVLATSACSSGGSDPPEDGFERAMEFCEVGEDPADVRIDSGGRELRINNRGDQDGSGIPIESVWCLLGELDAPRDVVDAMVATSARDGAQDDEWGGYEVTWTYHPDNGLDVFIFR